MRKLGDVILGLSRRVWLLVVAAAVICGMPGVASADTINLQAPNWDMNATLTTSGGSSGTWQLTMNFVNGTANKVDLNSFALQIFVAGNGESFTVGTATLNGSPLTSPWEVFSDTKVSNGSSPDCSGNTNKGWLCVDTGNPTLHPLGIDAGTTATFFFSGTYSNTNAINPMDLMASGCLVAGTCMLDGGTNDQNKWAVSGALGPGATTPTPEPSSLALIGSGLLALGSFAKRRFRKA